MATLGAAAAAMILVAPPAAAATIRTVTMVSTQGMTATTCPVTLTATVRPPVAGGEVVFKDGNTAIGAPTAVANGTASINHTFTTAGAHVIVATFGGATVGGDTFLRSEGPSTVNVATGLNLGSACLPIG